MKPKRVLVYILSRHTHCFCATAAIIQIRFLIRLVPRPAATRRPHPTPRISNQNGGGDKLFRDPLVPAGALTTPLPGAGSARCCRCASRAWSSTRASPTPWRAAPPRTPACSRLSLPTGGPVRHRLFPPPLCPPSQPLRPVYVDVYKGG